MQTWIALFRGINVGGNNILPMAELRALIERLGMTKVRTYIQSGNAVFSASKGTATVLQNRIANEVESQFAFKPRILLMKREKFVDSVASNPFPEGALDPKSVHFFFLEDVPLNPDLELLNQVKADSERFHLVQDIFYLHAPDGIGRSKLASKVEKALGVVGTGRNYRTVAKLMDLASKGE